MTFYWPEDVSGSNRLIFKRDTAAPRRNDAYHPSQLEPAGPRRRAKKQQIRPIPFGRNVSWFHIAIINT